MKLFRVLVLVVALVAGGIAAYLALNMGGGPEAPTVVELAPQIESQDVLVAAADIGQGQKLTAENIRWQRWPDDAMNPSYIQKQTQPDAVDSLQGSIVRSQFVAGEPIRDVKLARPGSGFLSAILPSGMRAIAVRVSANNTAGGFILPNDRVDVVQTISQQSSQDAASESVSRTILTNVKVLAIDQTVDEQQASDDSSETVVVGKTATLELDPAQVELITSAEASGTLSLSLRSVADSDQSQTTLRESEGERQSSTVRLIRSGRSQIVTTQ
jgi:pilus assembly protein CpaB